MTIPFSHRHLLDIEQLSPSDILTVLNLADRYAEQNRSPDKKIDKLAGKTVVNMFLESSTRTRTSFEIAAKRLGADVVNFNAALSSINKGETLLDTMRVIDAMQADAIVIRHQENGAPEFVSRHVQASILNAGDGSNAHPTQALLDALTIRRHKGRLEGLKIAICGDVEHSRVARSNIRLFKKFGAEFKIFTPPQFIPKDLGSLGVTACLTMEEALQDADVVAMLRIQNERLTGSEFTMSVAEYHKQYGLNHAKLKAAKPDVIITHPLPMNRGVEITDELADDAKYSVFFEQVEMGVAVRMACLDLLLSAMG
ncbi:MAG: aspartate carbamoyltransferase catalytic subunit [Alphaproteobacteria bacterium]|nr:aspartate carbamoyltransferase catalytic subunit [Alphaproteobacteria bacterium]